MTIQTHLDQLRRATAGCQLTAFGDLSSNLILRSSAAAHCPREVLDSLSTKAATCFSVLETDPTEDLTETGHYGQTAIMFTPSQSFIFARLDSADDDVTCAVIENAQDVEQALQATRDTVRKIGEDSR